MKRLLLTCCLSAIAVMLSAQLRNPIIPGFHPDPSVCRVGESGQLAADRQRARP